MSESHRDPAIKLFGKTIPVPPGGEERSPDLEASRGHENGELHGEEETGEVCQDPLEQKNPETEEGDQSAAESKKPSNPLPTSAATESPKTPSIDNETPSAKTSKLDEEQSEGNNLKDKPPKKPDKILPCPRCNSLDTKFCYYNNYNVNQPRHFCKNCQRYWTAGGTMRNVPVGAGRRKNKNSATHYRHITMSEAIQAARPETRETIFRAPLKSNGTVLSFGSDGHLCESMASVLNLAEKTMKNYHRNAFHRPEDQRIPSSSCGENGDEHSSVSSGTASNSTEDGSRVNLPEPGARSCPGFPPHLTCFPGGPWPYPWNTRPWASPIPPPPRPPQPPSLPSHLCATNIPLSFYPTAPYWGCTVPGTWSIPWIAPVTPNMGTSASFSHSPTLGKHSREGTLKQCESVMEDSSKQSSSERCLWIPKTLRIDDPGEAARSSIWATLGIRNDKAEAISSGGLFKAFQSKAHETTHIAEASSVLHANPAALSRSLKFQESS